MENYLPENEATEFEGRYYINPNLAVDETSTFIDNLRGTQNVNNQQIAKQTANLGTNVPSSLGGLGGESNYWKSRYQAPNTATTVSNLRSVAQAKALNDILSNEQAIWKKRYQDAYKKYQKSAYDKSSSGGSGGSSGSGSGGNTSNWDGEIEDIITDGSGGGTTAGSELILDAEDLKQGGKYITDIGTGDILRIDDTKNPYEPGYMTRYQRQEDGTYKKIGG